MYTVMHVGYPVAGRPIRADEWKKYSTHQTESAAWKSVARATSHLDYGQWDDHYIVIDPDGNRCDRELYRVKSEYLSAGRPPMFESTMRQTAVRLPDEMNAWLNAQPGGASETMRRLVKQAMEQ